MPGPTNAHRLSTPIADMQAHYDAVVVGSGYGGGVAASRLARMGLKVAVLERGREIATGDFPDTMLEAADEMQYSGSMLREGHKTALYDLHVGHDINVLVGCGLGGTSLINANVSLPPDPRVWEDRVWPQELLGDDSLEEGFARGRRMLRPTPYPNKVRLDKLVRLGESAAALGSKLSLLPINVAFEKGPNAANVEQPACTLCGDCCSGCNVGAKTTVQMTYLPDAVNHGAEIYCESAVRYLRRDDGRWRVFYTNQLHGRDAFHADERSITADIVVLGAGALGSTELLLRSKAAGLALPSALGSHFTGNGDVLAFGYNGDRPVNAIGVGHPARAPVSPPGPCITGGIDLRDADDLEDGMIIEEGVMPGGIAKALPLLFATGAKLFGRDTDTGLADAIREEYRETKGEWLGAYKGAMHHTQTMLVMAHDDGRGQISLDDKYVKVDWPRAARQDVFKKVEEKLYDVVKAQGGTYVRNPLQSTFLGESLVTVHPLGGCPMGSDAGNGVVNHKCQVFDADPAAAAGAVHEGLFVCDGSVIPRPLGVNPLLTITAVAERAMIHLGRDLGRVFGDAPQAGAPLRYASSEADPRAGAIPAGVEFTERMAGFISMGAPGRAYEDAAREGKTTGTEFDFVLKVAVADIDNFETDESHPGRITGTAHCPALSDEPLDVSAGRFNLMQVDVERVESRRFDYVMTMHARDGQVYHFQGFKKVRNDALGPDLLKDTTTLYVDIWKGEGGSGGELARGILKIAPLDFARQLTTLRGTGGSGPLARADAVARFGLTFGGTLFDVYGGALAKSNRYDPTRARKKRDLRVPEPEVHEFTTDDGKRLLLTRYKGGDKGPLMFSHGLGVSSLIFSIDTIDTNLLEFFVAAGFDCWLLDFRASIGLEHAGERWNGDDCAKYDYQPAVSLIRNVTGKPSVQVLAHCFGATTFVMSMLGGHLEGVRSAVISQIAAHVYVPFFPQRALAFLRAPSMLGMLGIDAVDARALRTDGFAERVADALIRIFVPFQREERSRNATSNRITALYGQLYETDQLNRFTFESGLAEMFGKANIDAFRHLARIARKGRIVDAKGRDVYMPNAGRLAIPISFVHGAENACFKPESTARTKSWLSAVNGAELYERHVIDGYGHIDCIFGKDAALDVYPLMLQHLEKTAQV